MVAGPIAAQSRNREMRSGTQLVFLSAPSGTPALGTMLPMLRVGLHTSTQSRHSLRHAYRFNSSFRQVDNQ